MSDDPSEPICQDPPLWWQGPVLEVMLADLIAAELGRMRPGRSAPSLAWDAALPLGEGGLDADSLERLRLVEALAQALDLDGADDLMDAATLGAVAEELRRRLPRSGGAITFLTSGSTGRPKPVRHDVRLLWQEVEHLATLFAGARRILSMLPSHPIYGFLFTVLLPLRLGVPVVDVRDRRPGTLPALAEPGDLIAATPLAWAAAAEGDWTQGVLGVTSGAPCPPEVAARLRQSGVRLREIYGSTETGGIGERADEREPFRLFPYWTRDGDTRLRRAAGGAVLSADLPDHVEWLGPDRLRPLGRRDGAVQVAGVNVHPERVRAVLLAHPQVAEARVRLMRPDEGDWLKAFVVPLAGAEPAALGPALEQWTRTRLSAPERPRAFTFGSALPVTPAGKPGDWFIEDA